MSSFQTDAGVLAPHGPWSVETRYTETKLSFRACLATLFVAAALLWSALLVSIWYVAAF
ncbi:MAG: hypothetical protein AAF253_07355 [Pseudomonadota bacterium]